MVSRRAPAVHPFSRAEETAPLGKRLHFRAWLGLALARNNSTRETNRKIFVRIDSRPFFLLPFFKNRSISKGSTESWFEFSHARDTGAHPITIARLNSSEAMRIFPYAIKYFDRVSRRTRICIRSLLLSRLVTWMRRVPTAGQR